MKAGAASEERGPPAFIFSLRSRSVSRSKFSRSVSLSKFSLCSPL